jgi:flagellin
VLIIFKTGTITGLTINDITIGDIDVENVNDGNGVLVAAINNFSAQTGVVASVDSRGNLELTSTDGRGIQISGTNLGSVAGISASGTGTTNATDKSFTAGRLTLTRMGATDIKVSGGTSYSALSKAVMSAASASVNLRSIGGGFTVDQASAMGFNVNLNTAALSAAKAAGIDKAFGAGVTTLKGAMAVMEIADSARTRLDEIRAGIGSVSNQLEATVNNISITQVNVAAAESQIRDVDFAQESANFSKLNILAQAGSYAMSQANAAQQGVLRLLQ